MVPINPPAAADQTHARIKRAPGAGGEREGGTGPHRGGKQGRSGGGAAPQRLPELKIHKI